MGKLLLIISSGVLVLFGVVGLALYLLSLGKFDFGSFWNNVTPTVVLISLALLVLSAAFIFALINLLRHRGGVTVATSAFIVRFAFLLALIVVAWFVVDLIGFPTRDILGFLQRHLAAALILIGIAFIVLYIMASHGVTLVADTAATSYEAPPASTFNLGALLVWGVIISALVWWLAPYHFDLPAALHVLKVKVEDQLREINNTVTVNSAGWQPIPKDAPVDDCFEDTPAFKFSPGSTIAIKWRNKGATQIGEKIYGLRGRGWRSEARMTQKGLLRHKGC